MRGLRNVSQMYDSHKHTTDMLDDMNHAYMLTRFCRTTARQSSRVWLFFYFDVYIIRPHGLDHHYIGCGLGSAIMYE